jgi:hypothetical protein
MLIGDEYEDYIVESRGCSFFIQLLFLCFDAGTASGACQQPETKEDERHPVTRILSVFVQR